jgi:hypothetical protein
LEFGKDFGQVLCTLLIRTYTVHLDLLVLCKDFRQVLCTLIIDFGQVLCTQQANHNLHSVGSLLLEGYFWE